MRRFLSGHLFLTFFKYTFKDSKFSLCIQANLNWKSEIKNVKCYLILKETSQKAIIEFSHFILFIFILYYSNIKLQ